jgi:nucleoside-diphosphate-sugar epimerase
MLKLKHILVTGANGFIGNSLCRGLIAEGWKVRGAIRSQEKENTLPAEVEVIEVGSISRNTDWRIALKDIDVVVHLAARVQSPKSNLADRFSYYRSVNVLATKHLAKSAESMKVRRFVYLSSIKVNGEGKTQPYKEDDKPNPFSPYSTSKFEAEQCLEEIGRNCSLETVVLRPPLVYGPGVKGNFLKMLKLIDKGVPLPFASVKNQRSLIFLENLIDAIITCTEHPDAAGKKYLVSDRENISTNELIKSIAAPLGKPARIFPFPCGLIESLAKLTGKSDAMKRLLNSLISDCSKICQELSWQPPYTLKEGIDKTIQWYIKERNQPGND